MPFRAEQPTVELPASLLGAAKGLLEPKLSRTGNESQSANTLNMVALSFPLNQPKKTGVPEKKHTHTHTHRSGYNTGGLLEK